jgi:hypothetical protein
MSSMRCEDRLNTRLRLSFLALAAVSWMLPSIALGDDAITVIEVPFTMPPHMIAGRPCGQ